MRTLWRMLARTVFWSYERGTWPYDLMVIAIVLFVLLTPRRWFHDQPLVGPPAHALQVQLLDEDPATPTQRYRVDAQLLAPPKRTPELEREIHEILSKNVAELKGRTFQIVQIEPVRGEDGTVLGYDVAVPRSR
jgi:hypothetical protein